jgi:drug/metabolite transporter (DMT)-like permease
MDQLKGLSRSSQFLLGAGLLLFIFLFFDWQQYHSLGQSGWHGWGVAAGIFAIALVLWEAAQIFAVKVELPIKPAILSAGLAAAVLLFTVIKFLVDNEFRHWPAWVGLILAIVIGFGGYLRWSGDAPKVMQRPARTPPPAA